MHTIRFTFEDNRYQVEMDDVGEELIGLPDGRVLEVKSWKTNTPPELLSLREHTVRKATRVDEA